MILRICFFILWIPLLHAWTHLELGAANYGSPKGNHTYDPNDQYKILFWTVEELVDRYGETGVFYVNDLQEDSCKYCAEQLRHYIEMQGYSIKVMELPEDFRSLRWIGEPFDTIHLKNTEPRFFRRPNETRELLKRLAKFSKSGLYFFTLYSDTFFPREEKIEMVGKGIFYNPTLEWEPVDYYNPSGKPIHNGRVFHILP